MEQRQRGNPAGSTNAQVAANVRNARHAIGMDLRTFSERVKETGRAMSTSALSKIENGDRRVDVDDLTVFAYILQTTPAELLAPPEDASPPTGVPSGQFNHEEIRAWVRGQAKFTTEDLARYWKDEYYSAVSSIHYYDNLMMQYAEDGQGTQMHRGTYEERSASLRSRRDAARVRLLALDPDALPAPRDDTADGWA
ncbi:helix-turn-helix domain-containing protein [Nocardioides allogilvus]|uniref:helix-turn-helix domain-containing protein n=1 Tax=Nocardioides allogilvus TaxID=2072017 RepID=UPI001300668E|nr:helix-turn-helix transcriptional regulator [Nocardioides allogilvus]